MTAAFIRRLTLSNFRSYHAAQVRLDRPGPVVLTGANGAGKTNLIEAISLLALQGWMEQLLPDHSAVEIEDRYRALLKENRARDTAAGRTLDGPHLSDLVVTHAGKNIPAADASTGEQKALLIRLVLAHAGLIKQMTG